MVTIDLGNAAQERGRRRAVRAAATSFSTLVGRAASFGAFLVLVPLTLPYLGIERFGVWMTLISMVTFLSISDLGMGNALITLIARTDAADDEKQASRYVSTALVIFAGLALGLGFVALAVLPAVPWPSILNVQPGSISAEGARTAGVVVGVYLITMPVGIARQIRLGYQEGYVNGWWDAGGSCVTVVATIVGVNAHWGLPALAAGVAAGPLIGSLGNFTFLIRKRPGLRPRLRNFARRDTRILLRFGGLFFVLQLAFLIAYSADNVVAAQVLGPEAVTEFAVPSRIILGGISLVGLVVMPLWPAYAEALARRDTDWVVRTFRRSVIGSGAVALVAAGLFVVTGAKVSELLSRGEVTPGSSLVIGLAIWLVLGSVGSALAAFLNGAQVVRLQVICASLMAGVNIVLSVLLARHMGVAGVVWATVISYSLFVVIPYAVLVPRIIGRMRATRLDDNASPAVKLAAARVGDLSPER